MHTQIERFVFLVAALQKSYRVIGDQICDVAGFLNCQTVPDHCWVVVFSAAKLMNIPMLKSMLCDLAISEMPFPAYAARPSVPCKYVRVSYLVSQIGDCIGSDISTSYPIMDAMLGWDTTGEKRCPTW